MFDRCVNARMVNEKTGEEREMMLGWSRGMRKSRDRVRRQDEMQVERG